MFVDVVPSRKSRPTILIRQAYREGGKAKKRTLANITKLPPDAVEKIRKILSGADLADVPAKLEGAFEISRSLQHGNAAAVLAALRGCGVDHAIASRRSRSRDLAVALVAQRILEPGSKFAAARRFRPETAVSTLASQLGLPENVSEDRLCETMDWLLEREPRIEKALAEKHSGEGSPVLYDLTSARSYSRTCLLADRGYSREGKTGLAQIEFGLLCDAEERPVAVEAFPGNASDPSTATAQVGKLRDRFGLKRAVFAGDRREPRVHAHLLICMLADYVEMHMRKALAPMLFDDEHGPIRDSPQARRKAASKRTTSGQNLHDFRGLLAQLGTLTMNRIEPSGPGKPGFDVSGSPTPVQAQALRLLNAKIPMRQPPSEAACPVDAPPGSTKYGLNSKICSK